MTTRTMRHCCANRAPAFRLESTTTKRRSSHVPAPSETPGVAHRNPAHQRGVLLTRAINKGYSSN
eukprot:1227968-Prymnesium_polylepis.1